MELIEDIKPYTDKIEPDADCPPKLARLPEGAKILNFSELSDRVATSVEYLIKPGPARGCITALNANYSAGKTTVALDFVGAGITGVGNAVWKPCAKFRSLFIFNEVQTSIAFFMRELRRRHRLTSAQIDKGVQFIDLDDEANADLLNPRHKSFFANVDAILAVAEARMGGPVEFIVLDSAQFNMEGTVNGDDIIKGYFQPWRKLAKIRNVAILVTWLSNKSKTISGSNISGSNNFPGIADSVLNIKGKRGERRRITTVKAPRLGLAFPDSSFLIRSDDGEHIYTDDWRHGAAREESEPQSEFKVSASEQRLQDALQILADAGRMTEEELRETLSTEFTTRQPNANIDSIRRYVRDTLKALRSAPGVEADADSFQWMGGLESPV